MSERIVRLDKITGDLRIVALTDAVSELSGSGLFSEIAPLLRSGEVVRLPRGVAFRALAALSERNLDRLPPSAAS